MFIFFVSSPSSINYALRKAPFDNINCSANYVAETIGKNFYVDDLLKLVEDEEYAKDLIKTQKRNIAAMFNLTRFVKFVQMDIPENHMRESVNDADLETEELPIERDLGVY